MRKLVSLLLCISSFICAFCIISCNNQQTENFRLNEYQLEAVYDENNHTLDSKMTVNYVNNSDAVLDEVCFHLYPNAYREGAQFSPIDESMKTDAYENGESYGSIDINEIYLNGKLAVYDRGGEDDDILRVYLEDVLEPTQSVSVTIDFVVKLANVKHRLGYYNGVVNCGNWYPIACVKTQNGFDSYPYYSNGDPFCSDCSNYKVKLTVPAHLKVASSGHGNRVESGVVVTYDLSLYNARDFAFVIGDFKTQTAKYEDVEVTYFYVEDESAKHNLTTACDALSYYSKTLKKYPYKTYNVVKTPFLHGGMEYPGMVMISDALNQSLLEEAIIHETAHQWWYAIVGNNEVEHAWMDEGLTEYSTTLFYEFNPSYNVTYKARMADATSAYVIYSDITQSDGVMDKNVNEFSSFDYTYLTYLKGALMFDALRKTVGDQAFFSALKDYCNEYSYKIATPDDMIGSFEKSSNRKVKGVFDSFIYGKAQIF